MSQYRSLSNPKFRNRTSGRSLPLDRADILYQRIDPRANLGVAFRGELLTRFLEIRSPKGHVETLMAWDCTSTVNRSADLLRRKNAPVLLLQKSQICGLDSGYRIERRSLALTVSAMTWSAILHGILLTGLLSQCGDAQ